MFLIPPPVHIINIDVMFSWQIISPLLVEPRNEFDRFDPIWEIAFKYVEPSALLHYEDAARAGKYGGEGRPSQKGSPIAALEIVEGEEGEQYSQHFPHRVQNADQRQESASGTDRRVLCEDGERKRHHEAHGRAKAAAEYYEIDVVRRQGW